MQPNLLSSDVDSFDTLLELDAGVFLDRDLERSPGCPGI